MKSFVLEFFIAARFANASQLHCLSINSPAIRSPDRYFVEKPVDYVLSRLTRQGLAHPARSPGSRRISITCSKSKEVEEGLPVRAIQKGIRPPKMWWSDSRNSRTSISRLSIALAIARLLLKESVLCKRCAPSQTKRRALRSNIVMSSHVSRKLCLEQMHVSNLLHVAKDI